METMKTENWWVRRSFEKFIDPHYGELTIANQAWKMTETPPRVKWVCRPVGGQRLHLQSQTRSRTEAARTPEGKGHYLVVQEDFANAPRPEAGRENFHEV